MAPFRLRVQDREFALPDSGELIVGRDAACHVVIEDRLASRRHAAFRVVDGELEVVDLQSLNGVRVNDVPIQRTQRLAHRDRVQIGSHVFVVLDLDRDRRGTEPATRASGLRRNTTRRALRAARPVTPLDTISHALEQGDVKSASDAMDAVLPRYADGGEPVSDGELSRITLLLLLLAERTRDPRYFDRIFQIHTARQAVIDGAVIDAIQTALPKLSDFVDARAIETDLDAMHACSAGLATQDQVRLRRVATLARRVTLRSPSP